MNLSEIDEETKNRLSKLDEFDEVWEQVIYRICETDFFMKQKSLQISELLNCIRREIENNQSNETNSDKQNLHFNAVEDEVHRIIKLSAVTNLEANDNQEVNYHQSTLLKNVRWALLDSLRLARPAIAKQIKENTSRVQVNAPIAITDDFIVNLSSSAHKGQIRLKISSDFWLCKSSYENVSNYAASVDAQAELQDIEQTYNALLERFSNYECYNSQKFMESISYWQQWIYFNWAFNVTLPTVEEFSQLHCITVMTDIILGMYDAHSKLIPLRKKYK